MSTGIKYWFAIIRPVNLFIILITQFLTAEFLIGESAHVQFNFYMLVFSTILIAASGNIVNDYYDIKIDYINKPNEVIAGKFLSRRWVLAGSIITAFLGVSLGFYLSFGIGIFNAICAFLLWFYSNLLKRLPFVGNLVIGLLTSAALFIVGLYYGKYPTLLFIYSSFAFFITLVREIIKDMEDYKGDASFGGNTLPISLGTRRTKTVVFSTLFSFYVLLSVLSINTENTLVLVSYVIFTLVLIRFSYLFYYADTKKKFHRMSVFAKRIMIIGVLSMMIH